MLDQLHMQDTASLSDRRTMTKRQEAEQLNELAIDLQEKGKLEESIKLYRRAARLDPRWAAPLYSLGLLFKEEHRWSESLRYNRRATAIDSRKEAAWWN